MQAEVLERAKQVALEGVPKTHLNADVAVEVMEDVFVVSALGCRRQAKQ